MVGKIETLEEFAVQVVQRLRAAGFTAYFAGGCVRDRLLAVTPKDYDVATDALPHQVREVFGKRGTLAIGASFGVITVLGPKKIGQIEVATFRSDGVYSDGRHPDSVVFSTPEEDAARRDFTINGMFLDPLTQEVIDFVNGQDDLSSKLIRAIGDPYERIAEDRLRMLRAVRFAATYHFEIEGATLNAIRQQSGEIVAVSQERITSELEQMLCHPQRRRAMELLMSTGLLVRVLPEIAAMATADPQKWERLVAIVDSLSTPSFATLIAAMLGATGAGLTLSGISEECRRLKVSNEVRKNAEWIVAKLPTFNHSAGLPFSRLQPLLVHQSVHVALSLAATIAEVDHDLAAAENVARCQELLRLPADQLDPSPLLDGGDLNRLHIRPGPIFAEILATVRNAQLDGKLRSKEAALDMARSLASQRQ